MLGNTFQWGFLSYRNQSIYLRCVSYDWVLDGATLCWEMFTNRHLLLMTVLFYNFMIMVYNKVWGVLHLQYGIQQSEKSFICSTLYNKVLHFFSKSDLTCIRYFHRANNYFFAKLNLHNHIISADFDFKLYYFWDYFLLWPGFVGQSFPGHRNYICPKFSHTHSPKISR